MNTDTKQVGGTHYKEAGPEYQHWNLVVVHKWDYFQAQVIKYLMRWKYKNGVEDLRKAAHYLEKYIDVSEFEEANKPTHVEGIQTTRLFTYLPGQVNPSGWNGFTFEGGEPDGDMFQCKQCSERFTIALGLNPNTEHLCPADPQPHGYVHQG